MNEIISVRGVMTPILGLNKPAVGGDENLWGDQLNENADLLDSAHQSLQSQIDKLASNLLYVGGYDASTNTGTYTPTSGIPSPGPLPAASPANAQWYVIVSTAGTGTAPAPAVPLVIGDWLVSDGIAWTHLALGAGGPTNVTAAQVAVTPAIGSLGPNVQSALGWLDANTLGLGGGTMQGVLTLAGDPVQNREAATKSYVDGLFSTVGDGGGVGEAPSDGFAYGRLNAAWAQVLPLTGGTIAGVLNFANAYAFSFLDAQGGRGFQIIVQADNHMVWYVSDSAGAYRAIAATYVRSDTSDFQFLAPVSIVAPGNDPLTISAPAGVYARVLTTVVNTRTYAAGTDPSGSYVIADISAGGLRERLIDGLHDRLDERAQIEEDPEVDPRGVGIPRLTIDYVGNTNLSGALNFGNRVAAIPTDLSQHINLFGAVYGFSITPNTLNYVTGGSEHVFVTAAAAELVRINPAGLSMVSGDIALNRDPVFTYHAATKGYVDAAVAAGGGGGGGPFLPLIGGTLSGGLSIDTPGNDPLYIHAPAGGFARLVTTVDQTMWTTGTWSDGGYAISNESAALDDAGDIVMPADGIETYRSVAALRFDTACNAQFAALVTSPYTITGGQLVTTGGVLATAGTGTWSQGARLEWNRTHPGSLGSTFLVNQKGLGGGGIYFGELDTSGAFAETAHIDATGNTVLAGTLTARASTLASLTVNGPETVTGNLTVNGAAVSIAGTLAINTAAAAGWSWYTAGRLLVYRLFDNWTDTFSLDTGMRSWNGLDGNGLASLDAAGQMWMKGGFNCNSGIVNTGIAYVGVGTADLIGFKFDTTPYLQQFVNGTYIGATCDVRVKDVTGLYHRGLDAIRQIEPITFRYRDNERAPGPDQHKPLRDTRAENIGVNAQDAELVLPEMIRRIDGYIDGDPVDDLRAVSIEPLVYALVNAVKELSAEVDALKRRLAAA